MAPRKRTTKQRKNDPKTVKMEAFLADFDIEVETRVEQLKEKLDSLLKDVDNGYNMALIKLPKAVRTSIWLEVFKFDKPKSPEGSAAKQMEEEAATVESIFTEDHSVLKRVKTSTKQKAGAKSSSEGENLLSSSKKRTNKKAPPTSKRSKALTVSKESTAIKKSKTNPLITPARSILDSSLMMGATPLITPRFDPRLPKTPALRVPRHKERVYSVSVNGSPIAAGSQDIVISVPVGNGENMQFLSSQMDSVDLSLLDETALRSIRLLQNRLTTLCGMAE